MTSSSGGFSAATALTAGQEAKQHLADGRHQIAFKLLEHVHIHVKSVVCLLDDAISGVLIDRQLVHGGAVGRFEGLSSAISSNT